MLFAYFNLQVQHLNWIGKVYPHDGFLVHHVEQNLSSLLSDLKMETKFANIRNRITLPAKIVWHFKSERGSSATEIFLCFVFIRSCAFSFSFSIKQMFKRFLGNKSFGSWSLTFSHSKNWQIMYECSGESVFRLV